VARDESVIGTVGVLITATRGPGGPGEVLVRIRGGSESYLARSATPLPKGTTVLITDCPGPRTVDVMAWDDPLGEAPYPGSTEVPPPGE
jgi:membrane protein implicated in regulation of membrane protease activity